MKTNVLSQSTILLLLVIGISSIFSKSLPVISVKNKTLAHMNMTKGPPILIEDVDSNNVLAHVRENAELECPLTGNPSPMFEWFKDGQIITSIWDRYTIQPGGRLIIRSVTHNDAGIYQCKGVNGFGRRNFSIQLAVTGDDPLKNNMLKSSTSKRSNYNGSFSQPEIILDHLPADNTLSEVRGKTLLLKCEGRGNPTPNVTWFKDHKNLTSSKEPFATLKLFNLTEKHNGKYTCVSSNAFGKAMYEMTLTVTGAWQGAGAAEILEVNPSNLTLFPGQNGSITCLARLSSDTTPLMVWVKKVENSTVDTMEAEKIYKLLFHDGTYYEPLNRNRTEMKQQSKNIYSTVLYFINTSAGDSGTYRCAAVGLMGFNHSVAHVTVEYNPLHVSSVMLEKQKSATVQRVVLSAFAFLILVVLLVVCFSRLYGCRGPLKNAGTMVETPKPLSGKAQVPKRSPVETLSTTLSQNQTDALLPLVIVRESGGGHNSRTTSTSISARQHSSSSRYKICSSGHLPHTSINSNRSTSLADSDISCSASRNINFIRGGGIDSSAMYYVNDVDTFPPPPPPFINTFHNNSGFHRSRDNHRDYQNGRGGVREVKRKRWIPPRNLPVPAPSCESSSSESSSVVNYYYEPRRHHHHHYYHHNGTRCPRNILPVGHLNTCDFNK